MTLPLPATPRDLLRLWRSYRVKRSIPLRNQLTTRYFHLVDFHARRIHDRCPPNIQLEDLVSAGNVGLMQAVEAFDLEHGARFESYARPRIRGAILDELRGEEFVPRLARRRTRRLNQARDELEARLQRQPSREELRRHLGVKGDEFARIESDGNVRDMRPMADMGLGHGLECGVNEYDPAHFVGAIADKRCSPVDKGLVDREAVDRLLEKLSPIESLIMKLYLVEGLYMWEIGQSLGYTMGRISQIYRAGMAKLREEEAEKTGGQGI